MEEIKSIMNALESTVSNGELKEALQQLIKFCGAQEEAFPATSRKFKNEAMVLQRRLTTIKDDDRLGKIEYAQYQVQLNQIMDAILDLNRELPTILQPPPPPEETPAPETVAASVVKATQTFTSASPAGPPDTPPKKRPSYFVLLLLIFFVAALLLFIYSGLCYFNPNYQSRDTLFMMGVSMAAIGCCSVVYLLNKMLELQKLKFQRAAV